jgi:hypothetical protein
LAAFEVITEGGAYDLLGEAVLKFQGKIQARFLTGRSVQSFFDERIG